MSKIYTRTGDQGCTSLFNGDRLSKDNKVFDLLGCLDTVNVALGFALKGSKQKRTILMLQSIIIDLSSHIATPPKEDTEVKSRKDLPFKANYADLEQLIDQYDKQLKPLTKFILPGGCSEACWLHEARVRCREAERLALPLYREGKMSKEAYIYLNRLSDTLFTMARWANYYNNVEDVIKGQEAKHEAFFIIKDISWYLLCLLALKWYPSQFILFILLLSLRG